MESITIKNRTILAEQTYRLEEISFSKPDGKGGSHDQVNEVYFRPDAVAVLLIDRQKEAFILAKQLRLPVFLNAHKQTDGYLLEACAGLIEQGESPGQAVIREAMEETGYKISDPFQIGAVYTSAGGLTEYLHLFTAEVSDEDRTDQGGGADGEGEDIELLHLGFDEAREKLSNGQVNDAKTMLLLQHFFLRL